MTHYLRFPDEATGMAALGAAGLLVVDPDTGEQRPILASHSHALDVIGPIYTGGSWDAEGIVIEPPALLPGWHVNFIGKLPDGWDAHLVDPRRPRRVFA
jgi:hypothetical protein